MQFCTKLHHTVISTQPNQLHKVSGNGEKKKRELSLGGRRIDPNIQALHESSGVLGFMMVTSWWRRSGWEMKSSGGQLLHHSLQLLGRIPWNSVPGLWLTPKAVKAEQFKKHMVFQQLLTTSNIQQTKMVHSFLFLRSSLLGAMLKLNTSQASEEGFQNIAINNSVSM